MIRKVLLIDPAANETLAHREQLDGLRRFRYCAHLGLQALANSTPGRDVRIVDERLERHDPATIEADAVGITVRTALAPRAHRLARAFSQRGIPVVFGGPYATLTPELALADPAVRCVVQGPGETVWNDILYDLEKGQARKAYRGAVAGGPVISRRDVPAGPYRPATALVQITRGCNFNCRFCVIPTLYDHRFVMPTVERAVEVIAGHAASHFAIVDDNLIGNLAFARRLFAGLTGTGKKWVCQATLNVARDPALLALMSDAGCILVNIGVETLNPTIWKRQHKQQNFSCELTTAIRRLHDHGICVSGGFIFGFDEDDETVFDRSLEFMAKSGLDFAACHILTPYPGLPFHDQVRREGRILTDDLSRYNTYEVVYRPRRMTPDQLQRGFDRVVKDFYSISSVCRRFVRTMRTVSVPSAMLSAFSGYVVHSNLKRGLPIHA